LKKLSAIFLCMFMLVTLPGCRAASGGAVKATGSVTFGSAGSNTATTQPQPSRRNRVGAVVRGMERG